jgi:FMN-dependent NADH-azoreductase
MLSWMSQWNSTLASNLVATDWANEGLPILDVVMFIVTVVKTRRRQNKSPWQQKSMEVRKKMINAFAKVLEKNVDEVDCCVHAAK